MERMVMVSRGVVILCESQALITDPALAIMCYKACSNTTGCQKGAWPPSRPPGTAAARFEMMQ